MDEKYLYSVNPRKTIKNIAGLAAVRTSKSLFLTKEEVLECIKCGTVYRRFSADQIIRVTPIELDRLHRDKFLTKEEFDKLQADSMGDNRGKIEEVKPTVDEKEETVSEKQTESVTTPAVEESSEIISEEAEVKEDVIDQAETVTVQEETDASDQTSDSETTTVVNDDITVEDEVKVEDEITEQVLDEQDAETKPNFNASSIQVNTSESKKKKKK